MVEKSLEKKERSMDMDMGITSFSKVEVSLLLLGCIAGLLNPFFYLVTMGLFILMCSFRFTLIELRQILCYLIIFSMFFGTYLSFPGYENIYLFRLLIPIYLCISLLLGDWRLDICKKYIIPLACFMAMFIISVGSYFYATYPYMVLRSSYFVLEIFFIFLVSFKFLPSANLNIVLNIISLAFLCNIIMGVIEVIMGVHLSLSAANTYISRTIKYQPTGFYFNTNDFAMYLTLFYPVIVYRIQNLKTAKFRGIAFFCVSGLSLYLVISTYSRIGMLCLGVSFVVLFLTIYKKNAVISALLFGPPLGILFFNSVTGKKLMTIIIQSFENKSKSTSVRTELYKALWNISKESHFLGIGAGGSSKKLHNIFLGTEDNSVNQTVTGHNFLLETLANLGILGFVALSIVLVYLVVQQVKYFGNLGISNLDQQRLAVVVSVLLLMTFLGSTVALSTTLEKRFLWFGLALSYYFVVNSDKKHLNSLS